MVELRLVDAAVVSVDRGMLGENKSKEKRYSGLEWDLVCRWTT